MRIFGVVLVITSFLLLAGAAYAGAAEGKCMDHDNSLWLNASSRPVYDRLMGLMACPIDSDKDTGQQVDMVACNYFVAKGLSELYGVSDFAPEANGGHWLLANQIADFVRSHPDIWKDVGRASDQHALQKAAEAAGKNKPTIAVMKGDPHGHVAIVLGGDLKGSTTWHLKVPNSAAFRLGQVDKADVFCRLSAAFSDPSGVEIYRRDKAP